MGKVKIKPTIAELEKILDEKGEKSITILPNGEITVVEEKEMYKISGDGVGLIAYPKDGVSYHIQSVELTSTEKFILKLLKKEEPLLGLATTEMLLNEIRARIEVSGLLKYRTVDDK